MSRYRNMEFAHLIITDANVDVCNTCPVRFIDKICKWQWCVCVNWFGSRYLRDIILRNYTIYIGSNVMHTIEFISELVKIAS